MWYTGTEVGAPAEQKEEQANKNMVKLVVPSAVCGGIIGKTGSTIRSYVEDSGAHIKLSSQVSARVSLLAA